MHSMPTCHEAKVARLATRCEAGSHRGCMATAEPVPQRTADEAAVMRQAPEGKPGGCATWRNPGALDSSSL